MPFEFLLSTSDVPPTRGRSRQELQLSSARRRGARLAAERARRGSIAASTSSQQSEDRRTPSDPTLQTSSSEELLEIPERDSSATPTEDEAAWLQTLLSDNFPDALSQRCRRNVYESARGTPLEAGLVCYLSNLGWWHYLKDDFSGQAASKQQSHIERMCRDDLCWHAGIYHSVNNALADRKLHTATPIIQDVLQLQYEHQIAGRSLLTEAVRSANTPLAYERLILPMLALGSSMSPQEPGSNESSSPSPLTKVTALHLRGQLTFVPSFHAAMQHLVELSGGINELHNSFTAELVATHDLMMATILNHSPHFPSPTSQSLTPPHHTPSPPQHHNIRTPSSLHTLHPSLSPPFLSALTLTETATTALDHHFHQTPTAPPFTRLVTLAHTAHRALLTLPPVTTPPHTTSPFEPSLRSALRIYSDLVLFPLPPSTNVRVHLAQDLQPHIDALLLLQDTQQASLHHQQHQHQHQQHRQQQSHEDILLYILTLGAVAAQKGQVGLRTWFLARLAAQVRQMMAAGGAVSEQAVFGELRERLGGFPWWGPGCMPAAVEVWRACLRG